MTSIPNFVNETQIEEEKKRRQEEWERVRKPEDPEAAPEQDHDHRCLYVRLKEQREKKQFELDEAQRLKHMVRGLDSEEVGFLDYVDEMKAADEKRRRIEERKVIEEVNKARESENLLQLSPVALTASSAASSIKKDATNKSKGVSKQAQLISGSIKRKSDTTATDNETKRTKTASNSSTVCDTTANAPSISTTSSQNQMTSSPVSAAKTSSSAASDSMTSSTAVPDSMTSQSFVSRPVIQQIGVRPTAVRTLGVLPGVNDGDDRSSDSSDSSAAEDDCASESTASLIGGGGGRVITIDASALKMARR